MGIQETKITPPRLLGKRGMPLWMRGAIVLLSILITATVVYPTYLDARLSAKRPATISQVKQIGGAALLYAADNNDHFPIRVDWEDSLREYLARREYVWSDLVFSDPNAPRTFTKRRGFAMNEAASGVKITMIKSPETRALFFTATIDEISAVGGKDQLRFDAADRATICVADGSVRSVTSKTAPTIVWNFSKR